MADNNRTGQTGQGNQQNQKNQNQGQQMGKRDDDRELSTKDKTTQKREEDQQSGQKNPNR